MTNRINSSFLKIFSYLFGSIHCSAADLYIKDYFHPYVKAGHPEATPLRILYRFKWPETVHEHVLKYCLMNNKVSVAGRFRIPSRSELDGFRVVISTLSTAKYLYDLQLEPGTALLYCILVETNAYFKLLCCIS